MTLSGKKRSVLIARRGEAKVSSSYMQSSSAKPKASARPSAGRRTLPSTWLVRLEVKRKKKAEMPMMMAVSMDCILSIELLLVN